MAATARHAPALTRADPRRPAQTGVGQEAARLLALRVPGVGRTAILRAHPGGAGPVPLTRTPGRDTLRVAPGSGGGAGGRPERGDGRPLTMES